MAENERSLALDAQVVEGFQEQVDSLNQYQVYRLPDLSDQVNHLGKYTRPSVRLGAGFFLADSLLSEVEDTFGARPDAFTFMTQPGHRLGRERSHNEVFFGKLLLHSQTNNHLVESQVAVKPTKNRRALLGELAMFQYLGKLGIPTFEPTSFLVTETEQGNHLLTKFEKPVATMDTVEWDELSNHEKWLQLDFAVKTMALLHSELLFHGDLEFKNVGFDETGDLIVIDPELMVSALAMAETIQNGDRRDEVQLAQLRIKQSMSNDFNSVCKSINEFIIGSMPVSERPTNNEEKFKLYARHLFRPYEAALRDSPSLFLDELLDAYEKVFFDHKQRSREN